MIVGRYVLFDLVLFLFLLDGLEDDSTISVVMEYDATTPITIPDPIPNPK